MPAFLDPLVDDAAAPVRLRNLRTGGVLAERVTAAFTSDRRRQGLLGRAAMAAGEALALAPCQAIHTWFMQMTIDVAFVSRDGHVVAVRHHMHPWRMAIAMQAYAVFEFADGVLAETGTRRGDPLQLELTA